MQLNIPAEQALGLAELLQEEIGDDGRFVRVLITAGDGGLSAAPLIVAFTVSGNNRGTFEISAAGTSEEV